MNKINEKRVFIAIPICTVIKPVLPLLKSKFNRNYEHIKWIPTANIHLTLKFIGNISINYIPILIQSLKKDIIQSSFKLAIESTGVFPSSYSPKVLWLGIKKGVDELMSLHTQIEKSLRAMENNNLKKTFTPHITIAKFPKKFMKIDVLPFLNTVYSPIELSVNSIYLYEINCSRKGQNIEY